MKLIRSLEKLRIPPLLEMFLARAYNRRYLKSWKELPPLFHHKVDVNTHTKSFFK
jgi:hypothetical protein